MSWDDGQSEGFGAQRTANFSWLDLGLKIGCIPNVSGTIYPIGFWNPLVSSR